MLITISGLPGSGKTTVAKILAKRLHTRYYSIGAMRRAMARERGLSLEAFNTLGERQAFTDRHVDQWQAKAGRRLQRGVFEGRTSFYFIPHSFKVYLTVNPRVAARRIFGDRAAIRRFEADLSSVANVQQALLRRYASDIRRYRKYYRLNIFHHRHYDLVLDTTKDRPVDTARKILAGFQTHQRTVDDSRTKLTSSTARVKKRTRGTKRK